MIDREELVGIYKARVTKEKFAETVAAELVRNEDDHALDLFLRDAVMPAIGDMFRHLSQTRTLPELPDTTGHRIEFVRAWEAIDRGEFGTKWGGPDGNLIDVAEMFKAAWGAMQVLDCKHQIQEAEKRAGAALDGADGSLLRDSIRTEAIEAGYAKLLDRVREGSVRVWEAREFYCFVDDRRYRLQFEDWKPRMSRYDNDLGGEVDIVPIGLPVCKTLEIEFETGDLLIADWFRDLPGFGDEEFGPDDYTKPSINSRIGCELETERHAGHGVIHVFGGGSPHVLSASGDLVVGRVDRDETGEIGALSEAESVGQVSTSLRWVTVADRKRLQDIVMKHTGCSAEEAASKVGALAETYGVVSAKVEPGTYTVHYSGDPAAFGKTFHSEDLPLDAIVHPYFVVTSRKLELSEKPVPATAPSP